MAGWDVPVSDPTEDDEIERLARDVKSLQDAAANIDKQLGPKLERLLAYFPPDAGEHRRTPNGLPITVKRGERFEWESDILEQMFASVKMPDFVSQRLTVPKRAFEKLDDQTKQQLLPALTRKPGPASVIIEV